MKTLSRFISAVLIFTQLVVFHTEKVALAQGAATSTSAMAASQALITASLPEAFQVDLFTGRAATSLPVAVPPGRKGMQPTISLGYTSSERNGWLGVGWDLDLGMIRRDTKNGVPAYSENDTFALRFQGINSELVKIANGEYRLKNEGAFLKVEFDGTGFTVRDKSGKTFHFGSSGASRLETTHGIFEWHLDRAEDLNGNYIEITHQKDGLAVYPDECRYTGHVPSGLLPTNTVKFLLEDRPDAVSSMISGEEIKIEKRLKEIQVSASGAPVRSYLYHYHQSHETARSLLESITQTGSAGGALPPIRLSYQEDHATTYTVHKNEDPLGNSRWMIRTGSGDRFHNNESILLPSGQFVGVIGKGGGNGAVVSFGPPSDALSGNDGAVSWSQDGNGAFQISGGSDTHFHAFTFFFLPAPATIRFPLMTGNGLTTGVFINGNEQLWFGNPGSQDIHLRAGYNLVEITGYNQNSGYSGDFSFQIDDAAYSTIDFMNSFQFIQPQFVGDFNGDGVSDFAIYDQQIGEAAVSFSKNFAFIPDKSWIRGFGNLLTTPFLGDFNRDGKTDWGIFDAGTWKIAYSNGMDKFLDPVTWKTGFGVPGDRPFTGDFNGDGFLDAGLFKSASGVWQIALSDGAQFGNPITWISGFGTSDTPFTGDFNGDGLTDILSVKESTGTWRVALSTGSGFSDRGIWADGFGAGKSPIVFDCNGDGLTDIGYFDTATGEVAAKLSDGYGSFGMICHFNFQFSQFNANYSFQPGDFTGDGILDPAIFNRFTGQGEVAMSDGKFVDLIKEVDNGRGGKMKIEYRSSAAYVNTGSDERHDLPFVLPLIDRVTQEDGLGNAYKTLYTFRGGKFDFAENEFRGFSEVNVMDAEMNVATTRYAQDSVFKGRALSSEIKDASGNRWTKSETTWNVVEPYPESRFVFTEASESTVYDGDTTSRTVRSEYDYDAYGNVTEMRELGDTARSGDERVTRTSYEYREGEWLMSLPHTSEVFEITGERLSAKTFEYDSEGNLRFEKTWLSDVREPDTREITTEFTYDGFGNITGVKDARGNLSRTEYDTSTQTFPVKTINALGHTEEFLYDTRYGEVTERRDANGNARRTELDEFGRAVRFFNTSDAPNDPTVETVYDDRFIDSNGDGIGDILPSVTQILKDESAGDGVSITRRFQDGLGRTIQVRSESEDPALDIVSGSVVFDERGLPEKEYVPYFENNSTGYVALGAGTALSELRAITSTFDTLGRRVRADFPDGTHISTVFNDATVRSIDARGNASESTSDGLGRTMEVREFLNGTAHLTTYDYDAADRLRTVTDSKGFESRIAYDSLGRKISLEEPDSGKTEYRYDDAGNLISETDALGVVTTFTYDALNRPLTKHFSGTVPAGGSLGATTYTYDGAEDAVTPPALRSAIGRLSQVVDDETTTFFDYDKEGRLRQASRFILEMGQVELAIGRTYDRIGRDRDVTYPDGQIVRYTYNGAGGIETVSLCAPDDSGNPVSCRALASDFSYNAAGQLTRIDYTNGVSTAYFYSAETLRLEHLITQENLLPNRLLNPTSYSPTVQTRQALHYQFDDNGNITSLIDRLHSATQNFKYDDLDRLIEAVSGSYGTLRYEYDPTGNLVNKSGVRMGYGERGASPHAVTSARLIDGTTMPMAYDASGNMVKRGDQELFYDQNHRLRKITQTDNDLKTISYDLKPGWNLVSFPVLPANTASFDGEGVAVAGAVSEAKIVDVLTSAGLSSVIASEAKQSLSFSPITQISRFNKETGTWQHFVGDTEYDEFDTFKAGESYEMYAEAPVSFSLTGIKPQAAVTRTLKEGDNYVSFGLDHEVPAAEIGNYYQLSTAAEDILRFNPDTKSFESLNAGAFDTFKPSEGYILRLPAAVSAAPPPTRTASVRTRESPSAGSSVIASEAKQSPFPTSFTFTLPSSSRISTFTYDSSGSRVKKKVTGPAGSRTSFFLGEGFEMDVEHGEETKSIFAGDLRLFTVELDLSTGEDEVRFHHPDHLGSLNVATDEEGARTFLAEYTPFGEVSRAEGEAPTSYGFTDQAHDSSGLIYMNARYYDPLCGRFISPDPIVQNPFDPQFLNRYTYVRNNPLSFIDPSGLVTRNEVFDQAGRAAISATLSAIPGLNIIYWAVVIYFTIKDIIKLFKQLKDYFNPDSDNGYSGIYSIDIIQSQFVATFSGLADGVRAIQSSGFLPHGNFPNELSIASLTQGSPLEPLSFRAYHRPFSDRLYQFSSGLLNTTLGKVAIGAGISSIGAGIGTGNALLPASGAVGVVIGIDSVTYGTEQMRNAFLPFHREARGLFGEAFGISGGEKIRTVAALQSLATSLGNLFGGPISQFVGRTKDFFQLTNITNFTQDAVQLNGANNDR